MKIEYANDLSTRLRQLNKSETIPFAFRAYATYDVELRPTGKELRKLIDSLNPALRSVEAFNARPARRNSSRCRPRTPTRS